MNRATAQAIATVGIWIGVGIVAFTDPCCGMVAAALAAWTTAAIWSK